VLINLIRNLGSSGKTIVTATHDLDIVPVIANRVIVIGEDRQILADGLPDTILRDHDLLVRANLIHEHLHEYSLHHTHHDHADGHSHEAVPARES
jgi:cobalt/nickel transport system ATP-binding protein